MEAAIALCGTHDLDMDAVRSGICDFLRVDLERRSVDVVLCFIRDGYVYDWEDNDKDDYDQNETV